MAEIQKPESSDSSSGVSDLPSYLIYEILVKLPINSVIRCRCVCKTWNNLISEKHFTTLYSKNPPFTVLVKFKLYRCRDNQSSCFIEIGLNGDMTCTPFNPRAINFQTSDQTVMKTLIGSCKGLLCLLQTPGFDYNNETVYIMNPILGEVVMLPQVNQSEGVDFVFYGFGFSTHSDCYKVLRVVTRDKHVHGEILTIGVDHTWRSFEDSSIPQYIISRAVYLNGVVYMVGLVFILAFDMEEERGHRISLPSEYGDVPRIVMNVSNDNFYLVDNSNELQVTMWTLKRYGVVESWSKEIIMKSWIPLDLRFDLLTPITKLRNGDLLISRHCSWTISSHCLWAMKDHSRVLVSYSPKTNECHTLEFSDDKDESTIFFLYVPSFFPLNTIL